MINFKNDAFFDSLGRKAHDNVSVTSAGDQSIIIDISKLQPVAYCLFAEITAYTSGDLQFKSASIASDVGITQNVHTVDSTRPDLILRNGGFGTEQSPIELSKMSSLGHGKFAFIIDKADVAFTHLQIILESTNTPVFTFSSFLMIKSLVTNI